MSLDPNTKNQICARKQDIITAESSHTAMLWKDTNLSLSFIKDHRPKLGTELETLAKKALNDGKNHSGDTLNSVCFQLDKKYNTYSCVTADNNNISGNNTRGCCFAMVNTICN